MSIQNKNLFFCLANFGTISYGIALAWPSASIPILLSKNTPLPTGPLTLDQSSWVCSISAIGGVVGVCLFSWLCDLIGRKWSIMLTGPMQLISWLLIASGQNVWWLYVARFLIGSAGGAYLIVNPVYVTEISEDKYTILNLE